MTATLRSCEPMSTVRHPACHTFRPVLETRVSAALPLFRFDCGQGLSGNGAALAFMAGALIFDNGEAERTFLYRCQDRFLTYSSLWGLRSIFLAMDEGHADLYRDKIAAHRRRFERVVDRTGLFGFASVDMPLLVGCDIDSLKLTDNVPLAEQIRDQTFEATAYLPIHTNQISPTYARFISQLKTMLSRIGIVANWDVGECARMGHLARKCSDKRDYVELVRAHGMGRDLPVHVPTVILSASELAALPDYDALVALCEARSGIAFWRASHMFVKSSRNSAGNLVALISRTSFPTEMARLLGQVDREAATDVAELARQVRELREEVDLAPCLRPLALSNERLLHCKTIQAALRQHVEFLVQPEVEQREDDEAFAGIGLSFVLDASGKAESLGATAQIYRDPERKHFLGAYLSDAVEDQVSPRVRQQAKALCRLYAERGYRGPISFDARRNRDGAFEFIYDCNPRLTGIFPSLAVRDALRASGVPADKVLTLGYRGEFVVPDIDTALERLDDAGVLLKQGTARGAVLLPNLCRDDGMDLHFVNLPPEEVNRLLAPGGMLAGLSSAFSHPTRLFY